MTNQIKMIWTFMFVSQMTQARSEFQQAIFRRYEKRLLANHVIERKQADSELECGLHCVGHESCASVNYKTSGIGKGLCELNKRKTQETSDVDEQTNPEFNHLAVDSSLSSSPTKQLTKPRKPASCKEILERNSSQTNGVYKIKNNVSLEEYDVYCHMNPISGCGGGGWTLVMKIDGNKNDFNYSSSYWTNRVAYEVEDGLEGLTEKQTKLASYWNTPFRKICLGMKVNNETRWIALDFAASSLYNVIGDGSFKNTSAGKEAWKSLVNGSALLENCNKEGFSVVNNFKSSYFVSYVRVRIGLMTNNQDDCDSCNSCIGFGTSAGCNNDIRMTTCGNMAICGHLNNKNTPAFGFILVE
ncbi:uncharacterized protein LOC114542445 isoform X1 [Dendronephthya gigantea]|uniref:uncharacterized protein LOC114542445 isoform X1 n=1 Tax=Dendronephthya gigantea TaxID=151771 RepID=UPI00106B90C6|nr:uncharacterized protein LOC114542445 isoform X1 [Dendronephthya gigantea]